MEILRYFRDKGFEIYVLSKAEDDDVERLEAEGFHCIAVGTVVLNPWRALMYFYRLLTAIHSIQPTLIFSFTIRPNIFGSIAARMLGYPIVSNVTGTGPLTTDTGLVYSLIKFAYKFAFLKNQRVFFQNEEDYQFFIHHGYVHSSQAHLLPGSGVDTKYYTPQPKSTLSFTFLMVSRLIVDKGVLDYIAAARLVRAMHPDIIFQLLGPFWQQSRAKNTISKKDVEDWEAEGVIHYLGYTHDVRPYMAEADAVVLPSYREGCANVLIQAASMARPLIATEVTGCKNLIENGITGFLCELRNPESLAEKMIQLYDLTEAKRNEMGNKGREKMKNEYQKTKVLEAYEREVGLVIPIYP